VKPRVSAVLVAGALSALALPASAAAHAVLIKTVPQASVTLSGPPKEVALTYSEAVEPRFAIVSVTDAAARCPRGRHAGRRRTRTR